MKTLLSFFSMIFFTVLTVLGLALVVLYFNMTDFPGLVNELEQAKAHLPALNLPDLTQPGDQGIQVAVVGKGAIEKVNPLSAGPLPTEPLPIVATLAEPTLFPTEIPTPVPTATPVPPMDPVEYQTEATIRLKRFANALESWLQTNDKLMQDNSLLHDSTWQSEVKGNLAEIVDSGQALSNIGRPPEEYAAIDGWFKRVGPQAEALRANYLRGLKTENPKDFTTAGDNFTRIKEYLTQAAQLILVAGWPVSQ